MNINTKPDIVTIVGNRPQFIKMGPISSEFSRRGYTEYIIHTGQHFDENMSGVFFQEMGLPKPNVFLDIHSAFHGAMTGEMLIKLEALLMELKPRGVLLYGDTNSTLAAALAAVKLQIPIAHVEAGPRIYDMTTPEEINRLVADHASALRFCPDLQSVQNLAKEHITEGVHLTGDVMYDAFLSYSQKAKEHSSILQTLGLQNEAFVLMTAHRPNNTNSKIGVDSLLSIIKRSPHKVVFPLHPRTKNAFKTFKLYDALREQENAVITEALGYLDILMLVGACKAVLTDSGGLQKEAFWAQKPVGILLFVSPWPQIEMCGWQKICWKDGGIDIDQATHIVSDFQPVTPAPSLFGDGHAADHIVDILEQNKWFETK